MYQSVKFWEEMAKRYPGYDDPAMSKDVNQMISFSESTGIDFKGCRVLDIGCGTGTVAIPLAVKGARVTGIDLSEAMLAACQRDAESAGVGERVATERSDWESFNVDTPYDIVIASMTPAVSEATDIDKMLQSATSAGIYVGWGAFRVNHTVKHLFEAHGRDYPMQYGSAHRFAETMEKRHISVSAHYFDTTWEEHMEWSEAWHYATSQLTHHGIDVDTSLLATVLTAYRGERGVCFRTDAEKGVITWKH
jgi:predicted RNA methylase